MLDASDNVVHLSEERLRDRLRNRRPPFERSKTEPEKSMTKRRLAMLGQLYPYPDDAAAERPRTRGECQGGERPCPWVSCRYHMYLDVTDSGGIKVLRPELEPWELPETCALDVADRGGETLGNVGVLYNVTRERIRQIEAKALRRVKRRPGAEPLLRQLDEAFAEQAQREAVAE